MESIEILYTLAAGERICLTVTVEVKDLLEQADRQIRSQRRQDRRHIDFAAYTDGESENLMCIPQNDPAELLERKESYGQLHDAITRLTKIQRRRLHMYFFEDMTYRQIAEIEGVGYKAVARSVAQAVEALRRLYLA
jgi:RNA polymerase sigma-70 factor (ECF subfamily)